MSIEAVACLTVCGVVMVVGCTAAFVTVAAKASVAQMARVVMGFFMFESLQLTDSGLIQRPRPAF